MALNYIIDQSKYFMNVGIVGLGKMGLLHTAILNTFDDVKVVSISEKEKLITKYINDAFPKTKIYENFEDMFSNEKLDLVFITTPTLSHFQIMNSCIEHGINFFVEKPLVINYEETKNICKLLQQKKLIMAVGYNLRFVDTFSKTKELLEKKILGKITDISSSILSSQVLVKNSGWRLNKKMSGGGVLLELGCHLIDLLLWYFGPISKVEGKVLSIYSNVEDSAEMKFTTNDKVNGTLSASWSLKGYRIPEITINIKGEYGSLKVNQDFIELNFKSENQKFKSGKTMIYKQELEKGVSFDVGGPDYTKEDRHVIDCIKHNRTPLVDISDGANVQSVIKSMYAASSKNNTQLVEY